MEACQLQLCLLWRLLRRDAGPHVGYIANNKSWSGCWASCRAQPSMLPGSDAMCAMGAGCTCCDSKQAGPQSSHVGRLHTAAAAVSTQATGTSLHVQLHVQFTGASMGKPHALRTHLHNWRLLQHRVGAVVPGTWAMVVST